MYENKEENNMNRLEAIIGIVPFVIGCATAQPYQAKTEPETWKPGVVETSSSYVSTGCVSGVQDIHQARQAAAGRARTVLVRYLADSPNVETTLKSTEITGMNVNPEGSLCAKVELKK